jgi:deazaflavin-dependent oxidoreductase (nitroreductase family)
LAGGAVRRGVYARSLQRLGHARWFAFLVKHAVSKVDRAVYKASGGRLSASGSSLPTMLLTTTGRKSGKPRTVPVYYVRDGDNLVAACEDFGLDTASSWPKNLLANPQARVQIGGSEHEYRARLASEEEAARNMPGLIDIWPAHKTYRERTGKRYLFVFEPVAPA